MVGRSLLVWFAMLLTASINGAIRETVLIPRLGDTAGRGISTLILSALVLLLAWSTIRWINPRTFSDAWLIGAAWVVLVLAFEFLAGHYLFGKPWTELTQDYDLSRGWIWILVLITTAVAPSLAASMRGLLE